MFKERIYHANYTIQHKKAFLKIEKELLGKNTIRGYLHDIDKPLMYILFGKKITSFVHKKLARHHNPKTESDYIQVIIDYESCRYTKPDKPYTAREYIYFFKSKEEIKIYEPFLKKLRL